MQQLQQLGAINCMAWSFSTKIDVLCKSTCGTNLAKFIIPFFAMLSSFLLFNLSAAIMIESLKNANRFAGNRALLTKTLTKKRMSVIWEVWQENAKKRGQKHDLPAELGKVLLTVRRAVELPTIYYTRHVQVYCTMALHSAYRVTSMHPPSSTPDWSETFNFPLRALPTSMVLRIFDRDTSSDTDTFLGEARIPLDRKTLTRDKTKSAYGGLCFSEQWWVLRGMTGAGMPAEGRVKLTLDYFAAKKDLATKLNNAKAQGLAVPKTPIFAATPGVHGLLQRARSEQDAPEQHTQAQDENAASLQSRSPFSILQLPNHNAGKNMRSASTSGLQSEEFFKRVPSAGRKSTREYNLLHLDALLGYAEREETIRLLQDLEIKKGSDPRRSQSTGKGSLSPLESLDTLSPTRTAYSSSYLGSEAGADDTSSDASSKADVSYDSSDSRGGGYMSSTIARLNLASSRASRLESSSAVSSVSLSSTSRGDSSSRTNTSGSDDTATMNYSAGDSLSELPREIHRQMRYRSAALRYLPHHGKGDHAKSDRDLVKSTKREAQDDRARGSTAAVSEAGRSLREVRGLGSGSQRVSRSSSRAGRSASSSASGSASGARLNHDARTSGREKKFSRGEGNMGAVVDHELVNSPVLAESRQPAGLPSAVGGEGGAGKQGGRGSTRDREERWHGSCLKSSLVRAPSQAQIAVLFLYVMGTRMHASPLSPRHHADFSCMSVCVLVYLILFAQVLKRRGVTEKHLPTSRAEASMLIKLLLNIRPNSTSADARGQAGEAGEEGAGGAGEEVGRRERGFNPKASAASASGVCADVLWCYAHVCA